MRKAEEELLDPEEDEKRKMRRNRNRLAAARCRQKRLDQIETLQVEVNNWELKNRSLEEEVVALKAEKEELLDPEEDEKRKMRRNRNRLAAARCRQKRLDQIETLQVEVNNWEKKNGSLEEEVAALKADKEELQYILA